MKGTAIKIQICGKIIEVGDYVKVGYSEGGRLGGGVIKGKITELWGIEEDNHLQGRVESGWCFHDNDKILIHIPK